MSRPTENRNFVYRKKPRISDKLIGTFDIETAGLGGEFISGATYIYGEVIHHNSVADMFNYMVTIDRGMTDKGYGSKRAVYWYAHNGAGYDFLYAAVLIREYAYAHRYIVETVQQGQKPIQLDIPSTMGKVKLRDSFPFLDASLAAASAAYAPEYSKLGTCKLHNFTKENAGPGDWYDPKCIQCRAYLEMDVISLWHTMKNARQLVIDTFGIEPGLTAGSTAMRAWICMIPKDHVYYRQSTKKEEFARKFTTGAFTYPGCTTALLTPEPGQKYAAITVDRSAAFAACQYEGGYPVTAGIWTTQYDKQLFGMWEVDAWCPEDVFPCIPLINNGRKLWSTGRGTAYVTSEQYEFCIQQGYTFTVKRGLIFPKLEDVFTAFIRKCENLEYPPDGTPANPAIKALAKRMRNSLNGKFNIRAEMDRLYIGEPYRYTECKAKDPDKCRHDHKEFIEGAKQVIDPDTGDFLPMYTIRESVDAPYAQPVWYAITVSRQQLEEHRLRIFMGDSTFKFDTDSATSRPDIIQRMVDEGIIVLGPGYGNYKIEHSWLTLQSIGPKNYMGTEEKNGKVVSVGNCKGIPTKTLKANPDAQRRAAKGERIQIEFESTRTLIEMFKNHYETPGIVRKRSLSVPNSSEGWIWIEETQEFKPYHRE